jgi:hypothetical protein
MTFVEIDREQLDLAWGGSLPPAELPLVSKRKPAKHEGIVLAFYPADHYKMTNDGSHLSGFDANTAASFAAATHNVDYNNFGDAHAHANRAVGESLQHAIDSNISLAGDNGSRLHHAIGEYALHHTDQNASAVVDAVGVANHHLQDAYAHQGMSFAQHHALDASHHSPDADATTRAAATEMTNHLMGEVAAEMHHQGIDPASFHAPAVHDLVLPTASQVGPMFDYKFHSPAWDGADTRWNSSVNQQMYDGFVGGLHGTK